MIHAHFVGFVENDPILIEKLNEEASYIDVQQPIIGKILMEIPLIKENAEEMAGGYCYTDFGGSEWCRFEFCVEVERSGLTKSCSVTNTYELFKTATTREICELLHTYYSHPEHFDTSPLTYENLFWLGDKEGLEEYYKDPFSEKGLIYLPCFDPQYSEFFP